MPFSYYPRRGSPLAPALLADILAAQIPRRMRAAGDSAGLARLCDLDARSWAAFSPDDCEVLGKLIVQSVPSEPMALPPLIRNRLITAVSPEIILYKLELERRTHNCLSRVCRKAVNTDCQTTWSKSIGQLLSIKGFGAKCLVDFLTSLEAYLESERSGGTPGNGPVLRIEDVNAVLNLARGLPQAFTDRVYRSSEYRRLLLPRLPSAVMLSAMGLRERTFNALTNAGFVDSDDVAVITVAEVLDVRGFGIKCLVDYLAAVDQMRCMSETTEPAAPAAPVEEGLASLWKEPPAETLEAEFRQAFFRCVGGRDRSRLERNYGIIAAYYGLDGAGAPFNLSQIAKQFGLTKERIRQICKRWVDRLRVPSGGLRQLSAALALVSQHLPADADKVEVLLRESGFCQCTFRLEGLARAAGLFGVKPTFEVYEVGAKRLVLECGSVKATTRILRAPNTTPEKLSDGKSRL